jgi:hypothetical protein
MMHEREKSDGVVVPGKPSNKAERSAAETVEGRTPAKGNPNERNALRTQRRDSAHSALARVREAAKKDKRQRFTALLHHVYDIDRLRQAVIPGLRNASPSGPKARAPRDCRSEFWPQIASNTMSDARGVAVMRKM